MEIKQKEKKTIKMTTLSWRFSITKL